MDSFRSKRRIRMRVRFTWFNCWVGVALNRDRADRRTLLIYPFPCIGMIFWIQTTYRCGPFVMSRTTESEAGE